MKREAKNPLQCYNAEAGDQENRKDSRSSHDYCSTKRDILLELLSSGQQNAIPRRELESLTGWSGRMVRLMIEKERRAGIPILSDNANGYYLPGNSAERAQFVRSMRNRAAEILKTAQAVEDSGKEVMTGV